ncbi:hypothetical protein [Orrella dioscoreae]|uniref:Uncharacterized protein n=1 Tax=Orrella dioscoreae TaxID=1851544 RepID=A0A1C3K1L7_9BURK|nr:hypothetical protein [Orrella dioscoreae]SBT25314.1 hypothetical protein ODI_03617 [Orrella dioscoreae]SOE49096.1 hypothetical protein ODI_R1840 [Orrella dioscoreae]
MNLEKDMDCKHTPGPWRIGKPSDSVVADVPAAYADDENHKHYGGYLIAESVSRQNLVLIAAAPELLEALEEVLAKKGACWHPTDAVAQKARAAISKATGQTA